MQIHLFPDDLNTNYKGKLENADLQDFLNLPSILYRKDGVVFHWGSTQKVLICPSENP